jgi:hypothetical protein
VGGSMAEPPITTDDTLARARGSIDRASAELAERFVELLQVEHAHCLGVCGQLGIPYRTYQRWMSPDGPEDAAEFRRIVLSALDERRRRDLDDAQEAVNGAPGTHAATVWNMRKFRHESRFKRFYEPEPAKVELTGKDGGPVAMTGVPTAELLSLLLSVEKREDTDE